MKKKVLITGGAGFIGLNLIKFLINKNWKINVLDNLSNSNLKNLPQNINFIKGDIRNKKKLMNAANNCSLVIHLAAKSALQETIDNPESCISNNVSGTVNIIDLCIKKKIKLIFASTCAIYPLNSNKKSKEKDHSSFETPYSISKVNCENLINFYTKQKKIKAVILRFFNVYGEGQKPNSFYSAVVPNFIKQSQNNLPLTIYNSGNQKRDFINVKDVCEAIYKAINYKKSDTFNIGTGNAIKIKYLAELILKEYVNGKLKYSKTTKFDASYSCANIYKTGKFLKFKAKIDIKKGIKELINYEI